MLARATFPVLVVLAGAGCRDEGGDRDAFCATAQRFAADNPALAFTRIDTDDPAATATVLRDAADRLAEWAEQAPGAIDDDVDAMVDGATALAEQFDALAAGGGAGDEAAASDLDVATFGEASNRVVAYAADECGVDLDVSG